MHDIITHCSNLKVLVPAQGRQAAYPAGFIKAAALCQFKTAWLLTCFEKKCHVCMTSLDSRKLQLMLLIRALSLNALPDSAGLTAHTRAYICPLPVVDGL